MPPSLTSSFIHAPGSYSNVCQFQVLAMSTGRKLSIIPDKLAEGNKKFLEETGAHYAEVHFAAMKRSIEGEKPYYKS